ncbi:MAG: carboxymuconolactone decarboxylase family protein [Solirubrobacteraceae bacterium]
MPDSERLSIRDVDPAAYRAVYGISKYVREGKLEESLCALIDIRASQINGCAWCLDMHTEEARQAGVDQRRIDLVAAWEEAGEIFSERERAALAFTEAVTLISEHGVPDAVWSEVAAAFDQEEIVQLVMAIAAINVWNRMNVAVRTALGAEPAVPR